MKLPLRQCDECGRVLGMAPKRCGNCRRPDPLPTREPRRGGRRDDDDAPRVLREEE